MNSVLFPFWLWLLIVLIIILIVLWFLFRPASEDERVSTSSGEKSADDVIGGGETEPVSVIVKESFAVEVDSSDGNFDSRSAGILHVVDSIDEDEEPIGDAVGEILEEEAVPVEEVITETVPVAEDDFEDTVVSEEVSVADPVAALVAEDNLRIIEGIGPKIESVLKNAGVRTLRQLSEMSADSIQAILTENNLRLANPETWPEQARLAADGDMEALEALQDRLKGGRVV